MRGPGGGAGKGRDFCVDVHVGDILEMKKPHPCGCKEFLVTRVGMDFKIKCQKCGHLIMLPRLKAERNIRKITRPDENPAEG